MGRQISIDFYWPPGDRRIHQMRNFGEDLYRALPEDGWAEISIDEVDRATDHMRVTVFSKRRDRRIAALIRALLERDFLEGYATISETAPKSGGSP